ncbi:hypothetical protein BB561_002712 [Smittium simulii]|uniref:Retrotransposon gag domain-containing protein n=1 Tax=Smittium simulii TaxID=133385 RepID=A0A2T9YPG5_9FUNG|nr:hypothetical protein BB561_002712 [Smittium simulii]
MCKQLVSLSQTTKAQQPLEIDFTIGKGVGSSSHTATWRSHLGLENPSRPKISELKMEEVDIFILETELQEDDILTRMRNLTHVSVIEPRTVTEALADNAARNVEENIPTEWVKQPPNKFGGKWNEDVVVFFKVFLKHLISMNAKFEEVEVRTYFLSYLEADALKIGSQLAVIYPKWDTFIQKFVHRFDGEEKRERARKELEKLDLYRNEALTTFVDFTKIIQAMRKENDEEFKVKELLKKCSEQDRYRLLQMKIKTTEEVMEYFMEQEENEKIYGKTKRTIPVESSIKAKTVNITEGKLNPKEMRTPEKVAGNVRRLPFSSGNHAPDKKKVHEYYSPSRNIKQEAINLVEIPSYTEPEIAAVMGQTIINGREVTFQYDSGAAVSVISRKLVTKLQLSGEQPANIKLKPVIGESETSNVLPAVSMIFQGCEKIIPLYILENHERELLLLGISTLMKLGAEISLKKAIMTIEEGDKTYEIPLTFKPREPTWDFNVYEVQAQTKLDLEPEVNPKLDEMQSQEIKELLNGFKSTFSGKLEELREAKVAPCEIELLKDVVIRQRPYKLARNLQEEVMGQIKDMETQVSLSQTTKAQQPLEIDFTIGKGVGSSSHTATTATSLVKYLIEIR